MCLGSCQGDKRRPMGVDPTLSSDAFRTQVSRRGVRRMHSFSDSTFLVTAVAEMSSFCGVRALRTARGE